MPFIIVIDIFKKYVISMLWNTQTSRLISSPTASLTMNLFLIGCSRQGSVCWCFQAARWIFTSCVLRNPSLSHVPIRNVLLIICEDFLTPRSLPFCVRLQLRKNISIRSCDRFLYYAGFHTVKNVVSFYCVLCILLNIITFEQIHNRWELRKNTHFFVQLAKHSVFIII